MCQLLSVTLPPDRQRCKDQLAQGELVSSRAVSILFSKQDSWCMRPPFACVYTCHTHTHALAHMPIHVLEHIHMPIHVPEHLYMPIHTPEHMPIHVPEHIHMPIHTPEHIHMSIHVPEHMHMPTCALVHIHTLRKIKN